MSLTIRPRRDDNLPALAAALVRVHAQDGYPVEGVADLEGWLRHDRELQSWTALEDGLPIGQVTLTRATSDDDAARTWHDHNGGDIDRLTIPARLFVHPDHRGTGAGRLLMEAAFEFAQTNGLSVAFDVMLKDQAAIRLYESLGARRIADLTHHYGDGLTEPAAVYVVPR
ncbi:GNAT family N-acetyltransferase [Promicromonospora sp. NPDC050262]|uniref:GNAT family N-acetyltransferase n=1 Tax=Promicromonospora sp. NPDC050262 TaxID=3155036 RepID=UPI0033D603CB